MPLSTATALSQRRQARSQAAGISADQKAIVSMLSRIEKGELDLNKFLEKPQKDPLLVRAIDFISRPNYASAAAFQEASHGGNTLDVVKSWMSGMTGDYKKSFGTVLKEEGVAEGGKVKLPLIGDVTARGATGFAMDVLFDPLTYLTAGTARGAMTIGKAGAKKALTEAGEQALKKGSRKAALGIAEKAAAQRLARTAAGRAGASSLQKAARKLVKSGAVEVSPGIAKKAAQLTEKNILRKGGKELFEQGGLAMGIPFTKVKRTLIPGERIAQAASSITGGAREIPKVGSIFGNVIDYSAKASDVVRNIAGSIFTPGHEFSKQLKELTAGKKRVAEAMGLTSKEAMKVFPELGKEAQQALQLVAKNKRFAAQQGYKTMVDMFGAINPEEGKVLAMALEGDVKAVTKLSTQGKQALEATKELLQTVGTEQLEYGFISRFVKNFTPRFLSDDAKNFVKENSGSADPVKRGLVKIFAPSKNAERVLIKAGDKKAVIEAAGLHAKEKVIESVSDKSLKKIVKINKQLGKKMWHGSEKILKTTERNQAKELRKIMRGLEGKKNLLVNSYIKDPNLKGLLKDTPVSKLNFADIDSISDELLVKLEKESLKSKVRAEKAVKKFDTYLTKRVVRLETRSLLTYTRQRGRIWEKLEKDIVEKAAKAETIARKVKEIKLNKKFSSNFFGVDIQENTIKEINGIAMEKLGFNWFEEDLTRALPRYYTKFLTNKAVFDGIEDLPRLINDESGYQVFKQLGKEGALPGFEKFTIPQLEGFQAPRFMVDQVQKTYEVLASEKQLNKFIKAYDRALATFKLGVTAPWPTFHSTNFIGGQFSNFQYGLNPGGPKWMKRMKQTASLMGETNLDKKVGEGAVKDVTWKQMRELYDRYGGTGGFFKGDVGDSVYRKVFSKDAPLLRSKGEKLGDFLGNVGSTVEDYNRFPIFIEEMVKHGDPRRSVKEVFKYHFDYAPEAYTGIEREIFQRLVPFYRFMRGNIPLQLNALHSQTGKMTAVIKTIRDLSADSEKDKPEWLRRTFSIPLDGPGAQLFGKKQGDKVFMTLPLPLAEVARLEPKAFMSSITPFLKVPIEMIANHNFFFGDNIYNPNLPPAARTSKAYSILKPITMLPGVGKAFSEFMNWREKPIRDPISGEDTGDIYYEADAKKLYLLKNLFAPISRAYMLFGQMPDQNLAEAISETVLPFNFVQSNPAEKQVWDMRQSRSELAELVGWLKARNLYPEEEKGRSNRGKRSPRLVQPQTQQYLQGLLQ